MRASTHTLPRTALVVVLTLLSAAPGAAASDDYEQLVVVFEEFRAFQEAVPESGVRRYTPAAVEQEYQGLLGFQERLTALDTSGWPVWQQVDYHLMRAEMNALWFHHRVRRRGRSPGSLPPPVGPQPSTRFALDPGAHASRESAMERPMTSAITSSRTRSTSTAA